MRVGGAAIQSLSRLADAFSVWVLPGQENSSCCFGPSCAREVRARGARCADFFVVRAAFARSR